MAVAAQVGGSWCLDIGYFQAQNQNLQPADQEQSGARDRVAGLLRCVLAQTQPTSNNPGMVPFPPDAAADDHGVVARPPTADDDPRLVLRTVVPADTAELRRIHLTPEVRRWWDEPAEDFPWDEPDSTRCTIEFDGRVAGLIQYWEETEPKYRHAGIDLFLDPSLHGRGLGAAAITRVVRHLIEERGHHRITIDPAADNVAAIRCYEKVGFRRVGVMRSYERDLAGDGWHDGLLMELLSTDARA